MGKDVASFLFLQPLFMLIYSYYSNGNYTQTCIDIHPIEGHKITHIRMENRIKCLPCSYLVWKILWDPIGQILTCMIRSYAHRRQIAKVRLFACVRLVGSSYSACSGRAGRDTVGTCSLVIPGCSWSFR